ncbi:YncE family protein [Chitinasiproducens palmae]|uniref:40-residue YVTN family beta-propeller repeat-containing protein n=1 Tax=Chitinasiproducens palmae TaxID=1770053 RepID=A0A1H2PLE0_9BURK|nr:YncE family protein [Chitinasiproducens palmae]SDV47300.1 40-residue YVTN family beta-propeller repeat-containing protein [Chitinasiproducens palmae]
MKPWLRALTIACLFGGVAPAIAGQAPFAAGAEDVPLSSSDRVYAAEQFSNTVSVTDPASNRLLGVIRLGDVQPGNLSPLYKGQLLVHGMGFSPDRRMLAVVSVGSNAVTFIDTASNRIKHTTYVGRSPHEAFYTPDGSEVWVTVRGEDYVAVLDAKTFTEKTRIAVPNGPGMQIFSPDGKYGYVCSSFTPETDVVSVADHRVVGRVAQASPFCPNIAATPDGEQVWFTLKDIGKTQVFNARPPFNMLATLDTGPITNHVNFAHTAAGTLAYVTVGGLNVVKVFRTRDFTQVATIPVGALPHGLWPSGDGSRMYVGLENADALAAIDTNAQRVVATVPIGQAPQAVVYVPGAVPDEAGTHADRTALQALGASAQTLHLRLAPRVAGAGVAPSDAAAPTSVSLFDQGLIQVLQASVSGLAPKRPYVLALSGRRDGGGALQPLAAFTTNPAGAAIVNASGPIRQVVQNETMNARRYLVISEGTPAQLGAVVQRQLGDAMPDASSPDPVNATQ